MSLSSPDHLLTERTVHLKTALERQDMSCMYLIHHELGSVVIITTTVTVSTLKSYQVRQLALCGAEGVLSAADNI